MRLFQYFSLPTDVLLSSVSPKQHIFSLAFSAEMSLFPFFFERGKAPSRSAEMVF